MSTSDSGKETISKDDGTFSLMVTKGDKELRLDHPQKKSRRIDLENSFPPTTIDMVEIPIGLHFDKSVIEEKISEFDGVKIDRVEEGVKIDLKIKYETIEESLFEEREIDPQIKQGQLKGEIAKIRSILKKREN